MQVDIIGPSGAKLDLNVIAAATAGQVTPLPCDGASAAAESAAARVLVNWARFLKAAGLETRYNSTARFVSATAALAETADPATFPVAVLFSLAHVLRALVVGTMQTRGAWLGAGPFARLLPRLRCLSIPQSGVVIDGDTRLADDIATRLRALLQAGAVHRIDLDNLPAGGRLHQALAGARNQVSARHPRYRRRLVDHATGAPIVHHSRKTRQKFRRDYDRLAERFDGDLGLVTVTTAEQTDQFLHQAAAIVAQSYQAALGVGLHDDAAMRRYLADLASEGTLRGYVLLGGEKPIAYQVGDIANRTYYGWATSFLTEYAEFSPGILLQTRIFEDLIGIGVELYDFGHGDAAYKRWLCDEKSEEISMSLYGGGVRARAACWIHAGSSRLRGFARGALVRFGQLDRLRNIWRSCLRDATGAHRDPR